MPALLLLAPPQPPDPGQRQAGVCKDPCLLFRGKFGPKKNYVGLVLSQQAGNDSYPVNCLCLDPRRGYQETVDWPNPTSIKLMLSKKKNTTEQETKETADSPLMGKKENKKQN